MRKCVLVLSLFMANLMTYSATTITTTGVGVITNEDFIAVGVTIENINKVKLLVKEAGTKYKIKALDIRALEIEMNKNMLNGAEQNLTQIYELIDKIALLEAELKKDQIKYQIEVQKHISTEQYLKAKEISLRKIAERNMKLREAAIKEQQKLINTKE